MKNFLNEFKQFALKGNVMGLAVGVIIGAAFQKVVGSLTDNIISPIIGLFARQNFDALSISFLGITLKYGAFVTSVVNFVIMAFVVFLMVKAMNILLEGAKKDEPVPLTVKQCPYCISEIPIDATRCPMCTSELNSL